VRIQLICNSASGGGTDDGEVTTALKGLGATLVDDDPERIVAAGGDGTVGEAAALAARLGVPLAVVPTGTANDFARATELPQDFDEATELAATGTRTSSLELGDANGRPFVNAVAVGLSPDAARRAEPLKGVLGPLAYPLGAAIAALRDPAVRCRVRADGKTLFDGEAWQVIVAATGAFGGGSSIDVAHPGDGQLDIVVVPVRRRVTLLRMAVALRKGDIAVWGGSDHVRADTVSLEVPEGTLCNLDGERVDLGERVQLSAECDAFTLVTGP